jgi:hypothetical protein
MSDPGLPAMDIIFNEPEAVSPDLQKMGASLRSVRHQTHPIQR